MQLVRRGRAVPGGGGPTRPRNATLEKAHVVKEVRAVFSARPGLETIRPPSRTSIPNLFLAGDWTHSGWPATMESAVRSGLAAARAALADLANDRPREAMEAA